MKSSVFLYHCNPFQELWQSSLSLIQCGPLLRRFGSTKGIHLGPFFNENTGQFNHSLFDNQPSPETLSFVKEAMTVENLRRKISDSGLVPEGVLINYTDAAILRGPFRLTGLNKWDGPKILLCGDLHHMLNKNNLYSSEKPISLLAEYLEREKYNSIVIAFNPSLVDEVRRFVNIPVHSNPPGFFRYPRLSIMENPTKNWLLHIGKIARPFHSKRREIVKKLLRRNKIAFTHRETQTNVEAASLYNQSLLSLNIPMDNDLNHRFFEILAAGGRQIVLADRDKLLGELNSLKDIQGVFWAKDILEVEELVSKLTTKYSNGEMPMNLNSIQLKNLLEPKLEELLGIWLEGI